MKKLPLIAPNPPRLSEQGEALRRVEASGQFSNNGPEVRRFEADVTQRLFDGKGASLAVANATLGLMLAIRQAATDRSGALALMPALTFAATAQAAHWTGLTPLVCDIDPDDWGACARAEERLLAQHGDRIAVIVPYATFGNAIDLDRYAWIQRRFAVGVVIDAASSLGTLDDAGKGFAADAPFATVFSMHATKTFAVAEGGLIHHGDPAAIETLRAMANFGFQSSRSATLPGINAKLPEVLAVMANAKLENFAEICAHRAALEHAYRDALDGFVLQRVSGQRRAIQFMGVLLPAGQEGRRPEIVATLAADEIGVGQYFSPHLGEQPWMRANAVIEPTPVADAIGARMLSLPITDAMSPGDARHVADRLRVACTTRSKVSAIPRTSPIASALIVGAGPAGTALLTAATKRGLLPDFARGLVVVEREDAVGGGRLGKYAITSDSTATTFLTAVKDNVHPEIAALVDHPAGRTVAGYADALGVPLVEVGPLVRVTGDRLADVVRASGGSVMTGQEALGSRRTGQGLWSTTLRARDGATSEVLSHNLIIATGGHQPLDRLATQRVAGLPLADIAAGKLLQSDEVLALGGFARIHDLLAGKRAPKIVVIGGSTSALTTIALLLKGSLPLGAGAITLLHRRPLRPFYPTPEAAHAEGFTDFGPDDICPVSGFVYRLAGFRLEARELVLRMLRVDGRIPEPRVALHRLTGDDDIVARAHLADADIVIAALGYRPFALPLTDATGTRIALRADSGQAMVDGACRVIDAEGAPVPGVYGIGLAAGFVPHGRMGGEPSFSGQANGLWQWQNDVGLMIVDQVLGVAQRAVA